MPVSSAASGASLGVGSLRRDAVIRFGADGLTLVFGFVTGVITARELGPAGKGTLAVLGFLSGLFALLGTLGLGDVVIVWFGRKRLSLQEAVSRVLPGALLGAMLGATVVAVVGLTSLHGGSHLHAAIFTAAAGTMVTCLTFILTGALIATRRLTVTSAAIALGAATTAGLTFLLVVILDLDILGATLALSLGALPGMLISAVSARRAGLRFAPRLEWTFLRTAIPYGARVLSGGVFVALAGRLDVFLVYSLAGGASAGEYSVALTIAGVTGLACVSLTYVAFPRLASLPTESSLDLTARTARQALVLSAVVAVGLAAATPVLLPAVFGDAYRGALGPVFVLLGGYVLSSLQWVLTRSVAARGSPEVVARSWSATVVVMVVLDVLLVPGLGALGAAIGWGVATVIGVAICVHHYVAEADARSVSDLVPRPADLSEGVRLIRSLVGALR